MAIDLSNRVALVTGASRGLGAAIAKSLGAAGAKVAVNYFENADGAKQVVDEIKKNGGSADAFRAAPVRARGDPVVSLEEAFFDSPLCARRARFQADSRR